MLPLRFSWLFIRQTEDVSPESAAHLEEKLRLAQENPAHFKALRHPGMQLFSIRFKDWRKAKRAVYTVGNGKLTVLFILDRENGYKDMEHYLQLLRRNR